ncbi:MAG: hypothetical protein H7A37_04780 [Chlamydiales bacterium]|nr:hypothetical protein [Chlamydiia bacterium]MCP5507597.1 hypothetical protein [Chlamydiales bacterium]
MSMVQWHSKGTQENWRLILFGFFLLLLALGGGCFAYASRGEMIQQYVELTDEEREGFYMMSGVFVVMALFCLNAAWQRRASIH